MDTAMNENRLDPLTKIFKGMKLTIKVDTKTKKIVQITNIVSPITIDYEPIKYLEDETKPNE